MSFEGIADRICHWIGFRKLMWGEDRKELRMAPRCYVPVVLKFLGDGGN